MAWSSIVDDDVSPGMQLDRYVRKTTKLVQIVLDLN